MIEATGYGATGIPVSALKFLCPGKGLIDLSLGDADYVYPVIGFGAGHGQTPCASEEKARSSSLFRK